MLVDSSDDEGGAVTSPTKLVKQQRIKQERAGPVQVRIFACSHWLFSDLWFCVRFLMMPAEVPCVHLFLFYDYAAVLHICLCVHACSLTRSDMLCTPCKCALLIERFISHIILLKRLFQRDFDAEYTQQAKTEPVVISLLSDSDEDEPPAPPVPQPLTPAAPAGRSSSPDTAGALPPHRHSPSSCVKHKVTL